MYNWNTFKSHQSIVFGNTTTLLKFPLLSRTCLLNHSHRVVSLYSFLVTLHSVWKPSPVTLDVKGCTENLYPLLSTSVQRNNSDTMMTHWSVVAVGKLSLLTRWLKLLAEIWNNNSINTGWCQNQSRTASNMEQLSKVQLSSGFIDCLTKKDKN